MTGIDPGKTCGLAIEIGTIHLGGADENTDNAARSIDNIIMMSETELS